MRKQLLLVFLCIVQFTFAQVVSIGTGTNDDGLPIDPYYEYSYSQCLYLASEINESGNIYRITYKGKPGLNISNGNEWKVYMGHTSDATLPNQSWIPLADLTQVFDGTIQVVNDNVEITLTTPFNYNGTDNLIIAVEDEKDGHNSGSNDFYSSYVSGMRSRLIKDDNVNPDPSNPPLDDVVKQNSVANIDIDFNQAPCGMPSNLSVSNITTTSVDLEWTVGNVETAWDIKYGEAGFLQGTVVSNITTTTYSLSNLMESGTYDFYVRANCTNGAGAWVGPYTFSTACGTIPSFNENIDAVTTPSLPNCWRSILDNGVSSYARISSISGFAPNSSSNHIRMSNHTSPETSNMILVSPKLSNLSAGTHRLRFYAKNTKESQDIQVGTVSDPTDGTTFTSLELVDINGDYAEYIVDYGSYSGTDEYIAIRRLSTLSYSTVFLDDIVWEETPSCIVPTLLTVTDIAGTSANLGWTAGDTETMWNIEYGETGFTQGSGTMITGATTNSYVLTDLTVLTSYDFYVQADCGNTDTSTWTGPLSFTTVCDVIDDFPYAEGFDAVPYLGIPTCWLVEGTTDGRQWIAKYSADIQSKVMKFDSSSNPPGNISKLTTPLIDLSSLSTAKLKFDFKNPTGGNFEVFISTDGGSTYTSLANNLTNQADWVEKTYDITSYIGTDVKIQFKGTSNYGEGDAFIYLENVRIQEQSGLSVIDVDGVSDRLVLYPNPFKDVLNINDITKVESISIVDMAGRIVKTFAPAKQLRLGDLNSGMYLINLSYENGTVKTVKAIKK